MYVCHLVVDLSSVVCCINGLITSVDRNDVEENSCISQITLWHWYKTTTTRRYRGNFVGNNSHGNIIVPSPINENIFQGLSSHSIAFRIRRENAINYGTKRSPLFLASLSPPTPAALPSPPPTNLLADIWTHH